MQTLNDWVLVRPNEDEQQFTESGLTLPESMKNPLLSGVVMSVPAEEVIYSNGTVVEHFLGRGDTVFWMRGYGVKIKQSDGDWVLIRYNELIGWSE